jgi:hypothetical protein
MGVTTVSRTDRDLELCRAKLGEPVAVVQGLGCVRPGCTRHAQWPLPSKYDPTPAVCTRDAARSLRRQEWVAVGRSNRQRAALSATAARALRRWSRLPAIASVHIGSTMTGGTQFRPIVSLQIEAVNGVPHLIQWAREFDAPVRFVVHSSYVALSTETVVDGHVVAVWDHLETEGLPALAERLGVPVPEVGGLFDVTPERLAAALEAVSR